MNIFSQSVCRVVSTLAVVGALSACGGGSGGTEATAEGVYSVTLTGVSNNAARFLVLENGDFWAVYGVQTGDVFAVDGFVQGSGVSSNGSFVSSNAKDFGVSPATSISLQANYSATAKTLSGSMSAAGAVGGFSGGPLAGSSYSYDAKADLSKISGSWTTTNLAGETVSISLAASGSFTAMSSLRCAMSGTINPRASGKNVFDVSVVFGPAPCALAGQKASGFAVAYPLASGKTQLMVAIVDSSRAVGSLVLGER